MRQQGTITVNGDISGNNNHFNNNNYSVKNINGNGGNGKGGGDEPLAIGLGILAIVVVAAVVFLRHFEEIYFWLRIGALAGAALSVPPILALMRDEDFTLGRMLPALFGAMIGCAAMLLVAEGYNAIPLDMLQVASHPGHPFEVWARFGEHDHRLIGENMATVACLGVAVVFNILLNLHMLFATLARTEQSEQLKWLANFTRAFRAKRGGIVAAAVVSMGYFVVSGLAYDLLSRAH